MLKAPEHPRLKVDDRFCCCFVWLEAVRFCNLGDERQSYGVLDSVHGEKDGSGPARHSRSGWNYCVTPLVKFLPHAEGDWGHWIWKDNAAAAMSCGLETVVACLEGNPRNYTVGFLWWWKQWSRRRPSGHFWQGLMRKLNGTDGSETLPFR